MALTAWGTAKVLFNLGPHLVALVKAVVGILSAYSRTGVIMSGAESALLAPDNRPYDALPIKSHPGGEPPRLTLTSEELDAIREELLKSQSREELLIKLGALAGLITAAELWSKR